ncbi:MAG: hypothetical protein A2V98_10230 [Planctomycetes bacterium RBG_16_64_12]|nr:MAG: hypothetical protein A2V98_10230 [Planctomycetes bacterium RBG_16_64_12]
MALQLLTGLGQMALLLATVAYCGSKMYWRPHPFFQSVAQVAVFTAVVVLGTLFFVWAGSNLVLLKPLLRRVTRPITDIVTEFQLFFF